MVTPPWAQLAHALPHFRRILFAHVKSHCRAGKLVTFSWLWVYRALPVPTDSGAVPDAPWEGGGDSLVLLPGTGRGSRQGFPTAAWGDDSNCWCPLP